MKPYWRAEGFDWRSFAQLSFNKDLKYERPELWTGYNAACSERETIRPHIEYGFYPERLFKERAPNQTEQEAAYMKANFKQVTLSHYEDYQNSILRALHENNWTIRYGNAEDEQDERTNDFQNYVNTGLEEFGSLLNYVRYIVPKVKTLDAMGLMVVLPKTIDTVPGADGAEVIDPDGEIKPVPQYIKVEDVWGFDYDSWYLWLTNEKSEVLRGSEKVKQGLVLMMVDDTNVYKIIQVGEKYKFTFRIDTWWQHGLGYAPAMHLRGNPKEEDGAMLWQSPYLSACEPLDQVLLDTSYLGASKAKCVFPHKVMIGDECEFVEPETGSKCRGGILEWYVGDDPDSRTLRQRNCPNCKGTGMKSRLGPLGELLVRPPNRLDDRGEAPISGNALTFVAPDVTSLEFLRSEIMDNTTSARTMMHLSTEQPMTGGDKKTATESGLDNKSHYAFIKPISDQVFDLYEFILVATGEERYGTEFTGISLTRPTSFDVRGESDMYAEIKDGRKDADLPPPMIDSLVWKLIKARTQSDPEELMVMETLAAADDLFANSTASIQFQLSQQAIEKWQLVLHTQALSIYDELARTDKLVRTGDQKADLEANKLAMQALAKKRTPAQVNPALDRLGMAIVK